MVSREVHLVWTADSDGVRWTGVAVAAGEPSLHVPGPRPFSVVPDDLLRRAG